MADGRFTGSTPCTPATPADDALNRLRLIRSPRIGPVTYWRLIAEHGSASAALDALPGIASAAGLADYAPCPPETAAAEIAAGNRLGARLVTSDMLAYPAPLSELPDAPPLVWMLGDPAVLARPMVGLVGARNASSLGLRIARRLAGELREAGFTVVSGLARGIDAAAHEAALPGATVAVQAGGLDVLYPAENADLARRIGETGCRLSEQPIGLQPAPRHFPLRNRLISGLSRAVVVVEAASRSGSLITARNALDQGREVLAVPGHPFDARSGGCNLLIRDGATLVRSAEDVIEALTAAAPLRPSPAVAARPAAAAAASVPPKRRRAPSPALREIAALHRQILDRLGPSPLAEDQLIRDLALPAAAVAPELVTLELAGRILRQPGGLLSRPN
ncbi:DNA-processing protein DprA [Solirhodobacter olei]|uniref:DNA-processing protein DprA n=1 Tax=Solirhodobacter olei TaxID=2493082 RepID=UPI000FD884C6|nr:DNA-processing protein DprA [Solirhodobacter olei]